MKRFLFAILAVLFFSSCNENFEAAYPYFKAYQRDAVRQFMSENQRTILFFWPEWCQASPKMFEQNIRPYLEHEVQGLGIVIVYIGAQKDMLQPDWAKDNVLVLNKKSLSGLDKIWINRECRSLLKDYRKVSYVPVGILCDAQGNILNRWTEEERASIVTTDAKGNVIETPWSYKSISYALPLDSVMVKRETVYDSCSSSSSF